MATVNDSVTGTGLNQFQYSTNPGWSRCTLANCAGVGSAYQQDQHYCVQTNGTVHFRFNGTQIKIYTFREPAAGIGGYSIDGGPETLVDHYSPTKIGNSLAYTSPILPLGDHDLMIRETGTEGKGTSSTITIDKAEVYSSAGSSPTPTPSPFATPTVTVVALTSSIQEGQSGSFRFSRSISSSSSLTVFYSLSGPATLGTDYLLNGSSGQIVIPAGESSADLVVTALSDTTKERSEKVNVKLVAGTGYNLPRAKAQKKAFIKIQNTAGP